MMHLDIDTLTEFSLQPDESRHAQVLDHLVACPDCRSRLAAIAGINRQLQLDARLEREPSLSEQDIAAYLDHHMPASQRQSFAAQLHSDKYALKAALHYAASSHRLQTETNSAPGYRQAEGSVSPSPRPRPAWLEWLLRPTPAWTALSATAALVLVVALMLGRGLPQQNSAMVVAAYQDQPVMVFRRDIPGIGFFAAAGGYEKPFSGLDMMIDDNGALVMTWPAVADAETYEVTLYAVRDAQKEQIFNVTASANKVVAPGLQLQAGTRYDWVLSGSSRGGERFQAEGGFVLSDKH